MIDYEKTQRNKIKREVCDSIKKALRNRKVDDFKLEKDNRSLILDGEYGAKLQMSIFNLLVPTFYQDKTLEVLNQFLSKHSTIEVTSEDSLAAMLEAYIDEEVKIENKYRLVIYLWNEEITEMEKGYVISDAILPTDEHFAEFEECVMSELEYMTFRK